MNAPFQKLKKGSGDHEIKENAAKKSSDAGRSLTMCKDACYVP